MNTYPLEQLDVAGAKKMQFRLVEAITHHFDGHEILQAGDYGLWPDLGRPHFTAKVEAVLAEFFGAEDACLVGGAGTGALRSTFMAALKPGQKLLVHQAPLYPTTQVTAEAMGLELVKVDFNDLSGIQAGAKGAADCALVQHARQRFDDRYNLADVVAALKSAQPALTVIVDDNYAAMRVPKIGIQQGADVSAFSLFKLLGPAGLACVAAARPLIDRLRRHNYSGGSQVQGPDAMEALRALVGAPVQLALQAEAVNEVASRLNAGEVGGVRRAYVANAQSRVVLVELEQPCARQVLQASVPLGAASHPVGAESLFEVAPLFYRVSGTFREENPALGDRMIRINPMRSGAELIIAILAKALQACRGG